MKLTHIAEAHMHTYRIWISRQLRYAGLTLLYVVGFVCSRGGGSDRREYPASDSRGRDAIRASDSRGELCVTADLTVS